MFQEFKVNGIEYVGKELKSGQAIKIAGYGDSRNEEAIGALITSAFERTDKQKIDVLKMTAAQRYFFVATYLMQDELGGEFAPQLYPVRNGALIDYIQAYENHDFETICSNPFELNGQEYTFYPLLGWHSDIVERTVNYIKNNDDDLANSYPLSVLYELACVAAQMHITGETNMPTSHEQTQEACKLVHERITTMLTVHNDSDFSTIMAMYYNSDFEDVFKLGFCDDGICVMPRESGVGELSPVMFRAVSCLTEITARMG